MTSLDRPLPRASDRSARVRREIERLGGVARTRTLAAAGVSEHHLAAAVADGGVVRVRRGWVATDDADPALAAAARAGVVLSCVTQAARAGLWVQAPEDGAVHVAASAHSGGVRVHRAIVHWRTPVVPRHPDALEDPIENVLTLVATCQPRERALAVWESALNRGAVDRDSLARLDLPPAAREVLAAATPWADSGLETLVRVRLAWLRLPIRTQVWIAGHRVDFLIGERLVLRVDGGHHVGAQRRSDIAHDGALLLLGYHVIRVDDVQVVERWHEVSDLVQRAVAQGLHRAR